MYRETRGSGSKLEIGTAEWKRISEAFDKHLVKSPPTVSRGVNSKDKDRLSVPSTSSGKKPEHRSLSKTKCSDGSISLFFFSGCFFFSLVFYFGQNNFFEVVGRKMCHETRLSSRSVYARVSVGKLIAHVVPTFSN